MKCLIQYVGKTVEEFHFRWNNYKNHSRNCDCDQPCIQRYLYELYSSVGDCRFLLVSMTLIDKTDPSDPFFSVWQQIAANTCLISAVMALDQRPSQGRRSFVFVINLEQVLLFYY